PDNAWKKLGVSDVIVRNLISSGMTTPTEIQSQTIREALVERKNIFGAAPTGSGKTLAFALPILSNILEDAQNESEAVSSIRALVLTPTRELATQIKKHVDRASAGTNIRSALLVGGL